MKRLTTLWKKADFACFEFAPRPELVATGGSRGLARAPVEEEEEEEEKEEEEE